MSSVEIRVIATGAEQAARVLQGVAAAGAEATRVVATGAGNVQGAAARATGAIDGMGGSLRRIAEIATGINLANLFDTVVSGAIRGTQALIKLGLETQRQEQAFARMTQSLGVNGDALAAEIERMSRGLINTSDVMVSAATALQEGLRPEQLTQLAEVAIEQSKLMGTSVTAAYNQMLEAIIRMEERGLKSAKVFIDTKTVLDDYAKALGTTAEKLTDAERRQALMAATLAKAQAQIKEMGGVVVDNTQLLEKHQVAFANWSEGVAKNFSTLTTQTVAWAEATVSSVNKAAEAFGRFQESGGIFGAAARFLGFGTPLPAAQPGALPALDYRRPDLGVNRNAAAPPVRPQTEAELKKAAAEAEKAAAAFANFRQELVELSIADQTAKQLMGVRVEAEKLAKADPGRAGLINGIRDAMEAVIVQGVETKRVAEEQTAAWKETGGALDIMETGLMELAQPLQAVGDLATRFALAGDDVTFSLGGATKAVISFGQAFNQPIIDMENAGQVLEQFGPFLTDAERAFLGFQSSMAEAALSSRVLGDDFDFAGARIGALRAQFDALVRASRGEWTPEIQRVGDELRQALADQSLYNDIEGGFLTVTDTASKMANALIANTLDIGEAFEDLGRNLATNFVQYIIHQVFDPLLKEAAGFVSGLIGILTGRGGLVQGAGGALAATLLGATSASGGGFPGLDTETYLAPEFGGQNIAGGSGGGGALGTIYDIGGTLLSAYQGLQSLGSYTGLVKLPSLLELVGDGIATLATSLGILAPALTTTSNSFGVLAATAPTIAESLGLVPSFAAAAPGTGTVLASGGAPAASGGFSSLLSAASPFLGLAGVVAAGVLPAILDFYGPVRDFIKYANRQRGIATEGFTRDAFARLAAVEGGTLSVSDPVVQRDISILLNQARNLPAQIASELSNSINLVTPDETILTNWTTTAERQTAAVERFVAESQRLGIAAHTPQEFGLTQWLGGISDAVQAIERYGDILARATALDRGPGPEPFDRDALVRDLLANPVQIALLLDLPTLQREGEEAGDTLQRMIVALDGLDVMMERLSHEADALRGDLNVPAALAENLARVTKAMDAARVAMAITADPERILAGAQEVEALIRRRTELVLEAVDALFNRLRQQTASITSGLTALSAAAPTLRGLGIEVSGITEALGGVVTVLGEVGDVAGQLDVIRAQVGTFAADMTPSSFAALTSSMSAVAAGIEQLEDPMARIEGFTSLLGSMTSAHQQATAAITRHFDELRQAEQQAFAARLAEIQQQYDAIREVERQAFDDRRSDLQEDLDRAIRMVRSYYADQRAAVGDLQAASRVWAATAERIRDQVSTLTLGPGGLSPLNPADQLAGLRQEFGAALSDFWAQPTADLADAVSALGARVLESGSQVFSLPSPAFAALHAGVTSALSAVAGTAEARVTPEDVLRGMLESLDVQERAHLEALGVAVDGAVTDIDAAVAMGLAAKGALEALDSSFGARLTGIDSAQATATKALQEDLSAKLGTLDASQQATIAALNAGFANVAAAITGFEGGPGVDNAGILGALEEVRQAASGTKSDLGAILGGRTLAEFQAGKINDMAADLDTLAEDIAGALEALITTRLDALGISAAKDALEGTRDAAARTANNTYWLGQIIAATARFPEAHGLGVSLGNLKQFAGGTMYAPGGPSILHPGEVVIPASKSAAQWFREGGFVAPPAARSESTTSGPVTVTINVNGAQQPRQTVDELLRELKYRGVDLVEMGRRR